MKQLAIIGLVVFWPEAAFATSFGDLIGQGYEVKLASNSREGVYLLLQKGSSVYGCVTGNVTRLDEIRTIDCQFVAGKS